MVAGNTAVPDRITAGNMDITKTGITGVNEAGTTISILDRTDSVMAIMATALVSLSGYLFAVITIITTLRRFITPMTIISHITTATFCQISLSRS